MLLVRQAMSSARGLSKDWPSGFSLAQRAGTAGRSNSSIFPPVRQFSVAVSDTRTRRNRQGHFQMGIAQNKSENRGKFSAVKKCPSRHHKSPHIHHKFTIKKPRSATRFLQNPLKNSGHQA
jgi:hypothetical protein